MNLNAYIFNKGMEELLIEVSKELIRHDRTMPVQQRQNMIAAIDIFSTTKDIRDCVQMVTQSIQTTPNEMETRKTPMHKYFG